MVKSPLIIGADLNHLKASSYSIYSQASVIAINQDPKGIPATRVWRYYVSDTDEYGQGEIQMWSGPLDNGDQVVALLNGGSVARPIRQPPVFSTMLQSSLIKTVCLRMIQDCLARKLVVFLQMLYLTQLFQLMVSPSIG